MTETTDLDHMLELYEAVPFAVIVARPACPGWETVFFNLAAADLLGVAASRFLTDDSQGGLEAPFDRAGRGIPAGRTPLDALRESGLDQRGWVVGCRDAANRLRWFTGDTRPLFRNGELAYAVTSLRELRPGSHSACSR
jgi:hypothetical protein